MTNSTSQSARHTKSRADDSRGSALSLPQGESPAKLEFSHLPGLWRGGGAGEVQNNLSQ